MAQVEFQYNGINTIIQCQEDQKLSEICSIFINKSKINENKIYFFYDGKGGAQFDKSLSFTQMANSFDRQRKKMNILILDNDSLNENKTKIKSKNIICPQCGEDIKIKIQNYKINLFDCKNNHSKYNISLNEFESTQIIDLEKIKCGICKEKNKGNTYKNEFFKCYECNMNICPLCKLNHNKEHNIYNYDNKYYICEKHNEIFIHYCNTCKKNICTLCETEHSNHNLILLSQIMPDKKKLLTNKENLKKSIIKFNENINKLIEKLNIVKININNYYIFIKNIINNYDFKKRNYEILYNLNEIINYNINITQDLIYINSSDNTKNQLFDIIKIYNKMKEPVKINQMMHGQMGMGMLNQMNNPMMNQGMDMNQQQQQMGMMGNTQMNNPMMNQGMDMNQQQQMGMMSGANNNPMGQANDMMNNMQQMQQSGNQGMGMNPMMNQMNSQMMMNNNQGMNPNMGMNSMMQQQMAMNPVMMQNQMGIGMTQASGPGFSLYFRASAATGPTRAPIMVQCMPDEKVSDVIEKYRNYAGDRDLSKKFIFNAQSLKPSLSVAEAGITNNANIFVV